MKRLLILIAVVAMLAAACSSDSDDDTTTTEAAGTDETTTTAAAAPASDLQAKIDACEPEQTDGDLNFYNWTEYIPYGSAAEDYEVTDLVAKFEEEYGVKIIQTFYEDNEPVAKIEAARALVELGRASVAKAYILYRDRRTRARGALARRLRGPCRDDRPGLEEGREADQARLPHVRSGARLRADAARPEERHQPVFPDPIVL